MAETKSDLTLPVKTDRRTPRAIAYLLIAAGGFVYGWGVYQMQLESGDTRKPAPARQPEEHDESILLVRRPESTYHLFAAEHRLIAEERRASVRHEHD